MKIYLLKFEMYDYQDIGIDTESMCNIYSSFELAKNEGLKELRDLSYNGVFQNSEIEEITLPSTLK